MLARVANSLYWAGRYLERSEHLARYLKVQYFSTFDAPTIQQKEVILRSILYMATRHSEEEEEENQQTQTQSQSQTQTQSQTEHIIDEQDILVEVGFNIQNPNSILSSVQFARENARNVRYTLSSELWETINQFYHYVKAYSVDFYKTRGLYDFTTNVIQHCHITRSYADSTLLHDDAWAFLKLGIYVERAGQIIRILNSKVMDIQLLAQSGQENPLTAYQWTTTLKTLEAFDMYRKVYKGTTNQENVIAFLLTHPTFPRSVAFTLDKVTFILHRLSIESTGPSKVNFHAGKLVSNFRFLEYEDIKNRLPSFLISELKKIYTLNDLIEQQYFE
jgi:uncharacterized alpha-E superfamily protein